MTAIEIIEKHIEEVENDKSTLGLIFYDKEITNLVNECVKHKLNQILIEIKEQENE